MHKENLNKVMPNPAFGEFMETVVNETVGMWSVETINKDLDSMFFERITYEDLTKNEREKLIISYFCLKRLTYALEHKCFPLNAPVTIYDPYTKD